jgi:DNA-binding MarR family transcriptional regulator
LTKRNALRLTRAQLACVESPPRIAIWGALRALGPSSIKDLARHVGRPPDALYFHVRRLERAGLVARREARTAAGRREAVFRLTAPEFVVERLAEDRGYRRSAARLATNVVRKAQRHYVSALARLDRDPSLGRAIDFHMINARLRPATLARLRRDLDRLLRRALRDEGESGRRVLFAGLLVPVDRG